MLNIEFQEKLDEELSIFIDEEFNKYAMKHGVICNYTPFNFVAKDDNKEEIYKIVENYAKGV